MKTAPPAKSKDSERLRYVDHIKPSEEEEAAQVSLLQGMFYGKWTVPDRTILHKWGTDNVRLPHSARSEDFDISISPWLREPMEAVTDGRTREITVVGAVQGAKTTIPEVAIPYWLSNDPGPIMFNSDTDPNAHDWSESRMYPTLRASPATADRMKTLSRIHTARDHLKWDRDGGVFALFQGAHAKGNLQGKSIRYLINDEPWLYPDGHLAEAYKRVTAFWNSLILNTSTGGIVGGELHGRYDISNIYFYHVCCPECGELFYPRWSPPEGSKDLDPNDPKGWGGMRWDSSCRDSRTGRWDYNKLRETIFYSCPKNGCHIKDTPRNRRTMSSKGRYDLESGGMPEERKAFHYNGIVVDWVPFHVMVEEWTKAIYSMRYGDATLFEEFILKRLAEFYDADRHRPVVKSVKTKPKLKLRQGMTDRTFRGGSVDRQYGHLWVLVRDWHVEHGCVLVHYEKVETGDEAYKILQEDYGIDPKFTVCDVSNDQTKGLRMCAKYGWTAIQGSPRKSFTHFEEDDEGPKKVKRIYSPIEFMDPWIGTKDAGSEEVGMIYFCKFPTMDRLFTLRNDDVDYEWRVPGDVGEDYFKQLDSWERYVHKNPRTGATEEEFRKVRKHDHLLILELYQVVLASIMGVIGSERVEDWSEAAPKE